MHENSVENAETKAPEVKPSNNSSQIASAIIIAGLIIGGAVLLKGSGSTGSPTANNNAGNGTFQGRAVAKDEHILGNKNAEIVIVEYSDTECPFCKTFHKTMEQVVADSDEKVAWVFRHYPIPQLHAKATREAEATECAWDQGGNDAFWRYTNRLFEVTTSNDGLADSELPKIAQYVGLNVDTFNNCLSTGKYKEKVAADVSDGAKAGVRGTPSSFILKNGKLVNTIPGALPYDKVIQMLAEIK